MRVETKFQLSAASRPFCNLLRTATKLFATLAMLLLAAVVCLACDCNTLSPSESFQAADLVFVGSVVTSDKSDGYLKSTFRVEQILKGSNSNEIVIAGQMSDCDFAFQTGEAYIVYARQSQSRLIASTCMSTTAIYVPSARPGFIHNRLPPRVGYRVIVAGVVILFALAVGYFGGRFRTRAG